MTPPTELVALMPCPFCGGRAEIERFGNTRVSTIYTCGECGCRLETGEEFHHGRLWNRRANADTIEAMAGEIASMKRRLDLWEPKISYGPSVGSALATPKEGS